MYTLVLYYFVVCVFIVLCKNRMSK